MNLPSLTHNNHTDPLSVLQAQTVGIVSAYHRGKLTDDELTVTIGEELEKAREGLREAVERAKPDWNHPETTLGEIGVIREYQANLIHELGLDDAPEGRKGDE